MKRSISPLVEVTLLPARRATPVARRAWEHAMEYQGCIHWHLAPDGSKIPCDNFVEDGKPNGFLCAKHQQLLDRPAVALPQPDDVERIIQLDQRIIARERHAAL